MATRIRILAGCFALGLLALLLTGTAAQAAPLSGAQAGASVSAASPAGHGTGTTRPRRGLRRRAGATRRSPTCGCHTPAHPDMRMSHAGSGTHPDMPVSHPDPAPTPTCRCYTPPPTPTPTCTCTPRPGPSSPVPSSPAPSSLAPSSPVPSSPAPSRPVPAVTPSTSGAGTAGFGQPGPQRNPVCPRPASRPVALTPVAAAASAAAPTSRWWPAVRRSRWPRPASACSPTAAGARRPLNAPVQAPCPRLVTGTVPRDDWPSAPPSPPSWCARAVPARPCSDWPAARHGWEVPARGPAGPTSRRRSRPHRPGWSMIPGRDRSPVRYRGKSGSRASGWTPR